MKDSIRLGILGAGKMAYWHLRAYRRTPGVRVAAICNPNSARGATLARKFGIPTVLRDPEELLRLPGLDAVDISVPTGLHKELICRAVARGLDVYTEKPLCRTLEEADEIVAANRRAGRTIFVGFNLRFCPEFQEVKRILDSGELGEVRYAWIQRGAWVTRDSYIFNAGHNAGIITEMSSHALDLLRWWGLGDVERAYAAGTNVFGDFPAPDTVSLNLSLRGGGLAVISNSYGMPSVSTEACLIGTRRMLRVKYGKCWVQSFPAPDRWSIPELLWITLREAVVYPYRILYNPFVGSCRHFVSCLREGRRPLIDERDGRETMRLASLLSASYSANAIVHADGAPLSVPGGKP